MDCQILPEINPYVYYFREQYKGETDIKQKRQENKIIFPSLDRGGGMCDLDGDERGEKGGEGATDPGNHKKKKA